jgi:soluble lytic murein transglycosylase-like protein
VKKTVIIRGVFAAIVTAGAIVPSNTVSAKEKSRESNFVDCPVANNIRVADARASERFDALSGCNAQIIHIPPAPLPSDPGVARITGVKESPRERRERERSGAAISSYRGTPVTPYDTHVLRTAAAYKVDPLFLHAIIATESRHNPKAVSRVGARGLMQIMPGTGRTLGVEQGALFDPAVNVDAGARLLKRLQKRYGRNFDLILSAYNAGEGAVAKYGNRIPPYRETQDYVKSVMARYNGYRAAAIAR